MDRLTNSKSGRVRAHIREVVPGTVTPTEDVCFFGGQLLSVPTKLVADSSIVKYTQSPDGTQTGSEQPKTASFAEVKRRNHELVNGNPRFGRGNLNVRTARQWTLSINWKSTLVDCVYERMMEARSFAGVSINQLSGLTLQDFGRSYVRQNVAPRYRLSSVRLYVRSAPTGPGRRLNSSLFNPSLGPADLLNDGFALSSKSDGVSELKFVSRIDIIRSAMDYYFDVSFELI